MDASTVIPPVLKAMELANERGWFDRIKDWISGKHPQHIILVGCSGVGKTQISKALLEESPSAIGRHLRSRAPNSLHVGLQGELFVIHDTPGELTELWQAELKECLQKRPIILHVVAYGFHEGHATFDQAITKSRGARKEYLKARRVQEENFARDLANWLGRGHTVRGVLTVVNKADLWWSQEAEVSAHYHNMVQSTGLGGQIIKFCGVIKRFYDGTPVDGNVDNGVRQDIRDAFIKAILEIVGKSK